MWLRSQRSLPCTIVCKLLSTSDLTLKRFGSLLVLPCPSLCALTLPVSDCFAALTQTVMIRIYTKLFHALRGGSRGFKGRVGPPRG